MQTQSNGYPMTTPDMDRAYGSKYVEGANTKEIAAAIRLEVKMAQKDGRLPKDLKISIRTEYYSGGSSIHANITKADLGKVLDPFFVLAHEIVPHHSSYDMGSHGRIDRHLPHVRAALAFLETEMAERNHDGSDSRFDHFDVKFYTHVGVHWELEDQARAYMVQQCAEFINDAKTALSLGRSVADTIASIDAEAERLRQLAAL